MNQDTPVGEDDQWMAKAEECLAGARGELSARRYNNVANRCYYACFQAAIAALVTAGIQPQGNQWGHDFVQTQLAGHLIGRRKLYPAEYRGVLMQMLAVRRSGDYTPDSVTAKVAERALRRAAAFVAALQEGRQRGG